MRETLWNNLAKRAGMARRRSRELRARVVWKLTKVAGRVRPREVPSEYTSFSVVPPPTTVGQVADVCARVNWYLSDSPLPVFLGEDDLPAFSPDDARHLDPELVRRPPRLTTTPGDRPFYLMRDLGIRGVWAARRDWASLAITDPSGFGYFEDWEYRQLRRWLHDGDAVSSSEAVDRLRALRGGSAVVLGTGPSASLLKGSAPDWDVRIICNSAVRDQELLASLRPNVVTFGDGVFHFGPSRYARAFRDDLRRAVDLVDPVVVVPSDFLSLLLTAMPELEPRTVGLSFGASTFRIPSPDDLQVKSTGNVLTNLMLPIGAMLASTVDIAGCDGRDPSETYFWRHGRSVQYDNETMQSAFRSHPAFFRDQDYADYYDAHCADLAEYVGMIEALGHKVRSVTPSFIPALSARAATAP